MGRWGSQVGAFWGSILEVFWGSVGRLGLHFGSILGVGGLHFGSILVVWAASGCQARLWGELGSITLFQGLAFGSKLASQIEPKSIKNRCKKRSKK